MRYGYLKLFFGPFESFLEEPSKINNSFLLNRVSTNLSNGSKLFFLTV